MNNDLLPRYALEPVRVEKTPDFTPWAFLVAMVLMGLVFGMGILLGG